MDLHKYLERKKTKVITCKYALNQQNLLLAKKKENLVEMSFFLGHYIMNVAQYSEFLQVTNLAAASHQ
jgi:hypothetical protein